MSAKRLVFRSETKLTEQQIADLIVVVEMMLSNAAKVTLDEDDAIKVYLSKGLIRIPKEASIYTNIKNMFKSLKKEKDGKEVLA